MPLVDNYLPTRGMDPSNVAGTIPAGKVPSNNWVRLRQPYLDRHGRACVAINDIHGAWTKGDSKGGEKKPLIRAYKINDLLNMGFPLPLAANAATLTKDAWVYLDKTVQRAARQRLRAADDLLNASPVGGFNAYQKMTYEFQAMSDPGSAYVDMDALTDGTTDTPLFNLRSLPLPITHSDWGYSDRELEVSRGSNMPFDMVMPEAATRRCAENVEDQVIGNVTGPTYGTNTTDHTGTSTVYGYTTYPQRLTKTNFTAPSGGGWSPETAYNEVLTAINQLTAQYFYGPFMLYHSIDWTQYMDRQFSVSGGNNASETLRTMLSKIPDIAGVRRLDRLTSTFTLLFAQMTSDVVQMVDGMGPTVVQWQEKGGLAHRWKVLMIRVPLFRCDYNSRCGVLHGTTS